MRENGSDLGFKSRSGTTAVRKPPVPSANDRRIRPNGFPLLLESSATQGVEPGIIETRKPVCPVGNDSGVWATEKKPGSLNVERKPPSISAGAPTDDQVAQPGAALPDDSNAIAGIGAIVVGGRSGERGDALATELEVVAPTDFVGFAALTVVLIDGFDRRCPAAFAPCAGFEEAVFPADLLAAFASENGTQLDRSAAVNDVHTTTSAPRAAPLDLALRSTSPSATSTFPISHTIDAPIEETFGSLPTETERFSWIAPNVSSSSERRSAIRC
jgi:hypothetical protein